MNVKSILEQFLSHCKQRPNEVAIKFFKESLTFSQLNDISSIIAFNIKFLSQRKKINLVKQKAIPIFIERGVKQIACVIACWKLDIAACVVDKLNPKNISKIMINEVCNTRQKHIIIDDMFLKNIKSNKKNIPSMFCAHNELERLALILFTSGSTGSVPKAVKWSHGNISLTAIDIWGVFKWDKLFSAIPFFTGAGLCFWVSSLYNGKSHYLLPWDNTINNSFLLKYLNSNQIDAILTIPFLAKNILIRHPKYVKMLISTGGDINEINFIKCTNKNNIQFYNVYGSSEGFAISYSKLLNENDYKKIGINFPSKHISIVDNKEKIINKKNTIGFLLCTGNVAVGYVNNVHENKVRFIKTPNSIIKHGIKSYKSNDLAYYDKNHNLLYSGRSDFVINRGGQKVDLIEIEKAIKKMAYIKNAIVIQFKLPIFIDITNVGLCCLYETNKNLNTINIITFLKKILPKHMIPNVFIKVNKIPMTAAAKVKRIGIIPPNINKLFWEQKDIWDRLLNNN